MAFGLNYGRNIPCIDAKAGIKSLFVAKWKPYISYQTNNGLISSIDADFFELQSNEITADVNTTHTEEGEITDIDISLNLINIDIETSLLLHRLNDMYLIVGTVDHYGEHRIYGLKNGMSLSFTETTGSSKTSFKGYNVKIKGMQTNIPDYGVSGIFTTGTVLVIDDKVLIINKLGLVLHGT